MRKNLKNRLGWVLWFGLSALAACTVQVKEENKGGGGSTGTGTAGSATAGGSSGSGGSSSAGAAGQGGTTASDGGVAPQVDAGLPGYREGGWDSSDGGCINDSTDGGDMANPDLCSKLKSGAGCYQGGMKSDGEWLCGLMHDNARPGAFQTFFNCIDAQTKSDACAKVDVCVDEAHWPTGCQVGKVVISNGKSWDCTNLVDKCSVDASPDGFTLSECDFIMNVFNDEARTKIFDCYLFKNTDPATCRDDFTSCVYNPDQ